MWCICSCLKSCIMVKYNMNIKSFMLLHKAIKQITQDHIVLKLGIFLHSEIKYALQALFHEDKDKDLLQKVGISIIYYSVLRQMEILFIEIKDAKVEVIVKINYPCSTKQRVKRFCSKCPEWLALTFQKYISQLRANLPQNSRFM